MATQPLALTLLTAGGIMLSGWLTEDKLPVWAKSLIAALCVFLAAIVYAAITGQMTSNFTVAFAAISAIIGWLMVGPLEPVHSWMVASWPGPLTMLFDEALKAAPVETEPPTTGSIVTPRPIPKLPLPTTPDMVQRSSLLDNGTWHPTIATSPAAPQPLQVPSVDPAPPSNGVQQAITGPLPAVPPQPGQGNTQTPGAQGGQGTPPLPYSP